MSQTDKEKSERQERGRRSSRRQKALENARFMCFFGVVVGIVIGLLIGIKYNVGARSQGAATRVTPAKETTAKRQGSEPAGSSQGKPTAADEKTVQFANFPTPKTINEVNPLLGLWSPKFNERAIKLGFYEDGTCNVYTPISLSGVLDREGVLLTSVAYKYSQHDSPEKWLPSKENDTYYSWPSLHVVSDYEFENRDGTTGKGNLTNRVDVAATLAGKETPQDTDDFIVYEITFYDDFFKLPKDLPRFSVPSARKWDRRVEADFRTNPNPFASSTD